MKDDIISRQAALDEIRRFAGYLDEDMINRIHIGLNRLPSAERHAHWEFIGGYGYQYRCSVCVTCAERKTKFCSNCGAKMDEVDE